MQREGGKVIDRSAEICGKKTEKELIGLQEYMTERQQSDGSDGRICSGKVIGLAAEMVQPKQRMFYGGIPQVSERKWR